eukprot:Filipodium_phascolosomae@DN467_c0_g1_i1.p1
MDNSGVGNGVSGDIAAECLPQSVVIVLGALTAFLAITLNFDELVDLMTLFDCTANLFLVCSLLRLARLPTGHSAASGIVSRGSSNSSTRGDSGGGEAALAVPGGRIGLGLSVLSVTLISVVVMSLATPLAQLSMFAFCVFGSGLYYMATATAADTTIHTANLVLSSSPRH